MMNSSFFAANRMRLLDNLSGGLVVLTGYASMQGTSDSASFFEQESNFWWLTGINEPDWLLIMDGLTRKSYLVAPEVSDGNRLFNGGLAPEDALGISGVDAVLKHDEAIDKIRGLAKKRPLVYTVDEPRNAAHFDFALNPALKKNFNFLTRTFNSVQDCRKDLLRLRAIKQEDEISAIAEAIDLTVKNFQSVKKILGNCRYEYEAEAELSYGFRRHGARHAFDPIVASGKNACTLHYSENAERLGKRELVLIDAGARLNGYPGDITRTYAVGEPTTRQVEIHKAVQQAEKQIISLLAPELRLEDYSRSVDGIMKEALISLGLMDGPEDDDNYRRYFPHAISHGLGVDVHDSLGGWKYLQANMILTVEPGIYIPEEGIGVRIEDNVLITDSGHVNLSRRLSTDL